MLMHMNGSSIGLVLSATTGPWGRASTKLNQPHYEAVSRGPFPYHQHLHKDVPLLVRLLYIPTIILVKRWIDHDKQPRFIGAYVGQLRSRLRFEGLIFVGQTMDLFGSE